MSFSPMWHSLQDIKEKQKDLGCGECGDSHSAQWSQILLPQGRWTSSIRALQTEELLSI